MLGEVTLKARSHDATHLRDLDINKSQSSRWQKVASLPDDDFEGYIAETVEAGRELSLTAAVRSPKPRRYASGDVAAHWSRPSSP